MLIVLKIIMQGHGVVLLANTWRYFGTELVLETDMLAKRIRRFFIHHLEAQVA